MQTRLESFIEAVISTVIGFTINYIANIVVLRSMGFELSAGRALHISLIFTAISVIRGYAIRRWAQAHLTSLKVRLAARIQQLVNR